MSASYLYKTFTGFQYGSEAPTRPLSLKWIHCISIKELRVTAGTVLSRPLITAPIGCIQLPELSRSNGQQRLAFCGHIVSRRNRLPADVRDATYFATYHEHDLKQADNVFLTVSLTNIIHGAVMMFLRLCLRLQVTEFICLPVRVSCKSSGEGVRQ